MGGSKGGGVNFFKSLTMARFRHSHSHWRASGPVRTVLTLAAAASVEGVISGSFGASRSCEAGVLAAQCGTSGLLALQPLPDMSSDMKRMHRWHVEATHSRTACAWQGAQLRLRGGSDVGIQSKPSPFTKMQNGLAASRAGIMWVIKGLLAAFTGLLTTSAVMVAFEYTAHAVRPVSGLNTPLKCWLSPTLLH